MRLHCKLFSLKRSEDCKLNILRLAGGCKMERQPSWARYRRGNQQRDCHHVLHLLPPSSWRTAQLSTTQRRLLLLYSSLDGDPLQLLVCPFPRSLRKGGGGGASVAHDSEATPSFTHHSDAPWRTVRGTHLGQLQLFRDPNAHSLVPLVLSRHAYLSSLMAVHPWLQSVDVHLQKVAKLPAKLRQLVLRPMLSKRSPMTV